MTEPIADSIRNQLHEIETSIAVLKVERESGEAERKVKDRRTEISISMLRIMNDFKPGFIIDNSDN